MYDKKGNSTVSSDNLGDLLRGLGQNPTQAEVRELIRSLGGSDKHGMDMTLLRKICLEYIAYFNPTLQRC
jgi:Ca2+-binding EF-hand superfamily protein